jgi:hypothetical protein
MPSYKESNSQGFFRTYNICSDTKTSTADTLFHKVKFGLREAFFICFQMTTTIKSFSASQVAILFGVRENTARLFIYKVREVINQAKIIP